MGDQASGVPAGTPPRSPEASVAPPPLLDGIVRVKVPPGKIQPFLAATALFKSAPKEVISRAAALFEGLECADGSELVTAGKVNAGLGILFSGRAQVLLPSTGGELLPVEELGPGDHFGEAGALLGKPSPAFVIASESSRVLWLPAPVFQSLIGSVPSVCEAIARRLGERMIAFASLERSAAPAELVTGIEEQLLQAVDSALKAAQPPPAPEEAAPGVIPFVELRDFDLSPSVLTMVPGKLMRSFR
ncbi:MAG: Crp/Fnr family transcriptional regulator, partial [Myxococcales bacterium]